MASESVKPAEIMTEIMTEKMIEKMIGKVFLNGPKRFVCSPAYAIISAYVQWRLPVLTVAVEPQSHRSRTT